MSSDWYCKERGHKIPNNLVQKYCGHNDCPSLTRKNDKGQTEMMYSGGVNAT